LDGGRRKQGSGSTEQKLDWVVSDPLKTNSVIYYLYFASQKEAGMDIVNYIFNKSRATQGR
jgi:hypothetical protein